MTAKWFDVALRRQKQDVPSNGKTYGLPLPSENLSPAETAPMEKVNQNPPGKTTVRFQGDLQSAEDIYRAAGIMNPRMGYSISKVVEMLNNDHIRGLSNEAKRAAVLMALEAAGVSIDEVMRDAAKRREALEVYESEQRKAFEEYWARKLEGNSQIQAEMERMTARCLDGIKHNLDEVAMEKNAFARWQTMKQQETERMAEAIGLCSKPSPPDSPSPSDSLLALRGLGAGVKPS